MKGLGDPGQGIELQALGADSTRYGILRDFGD